MVKYIKDRRSKEGILKSFKPIVRKWLNKIFKDLELSGELSGGLEEIIRKALAKII